MRNLAFAPFLAGALLVAGTACQTQAQTPPAQPAPPVPEAMPFDIPYGPTITLDRAKKVAAAAEEEAKKRNWKMACAIADPAGDLVYFQKIDGTQVASIAISQAKARTAATFRRPTKVFQDLINGGQPYLLTFPGLLASEGGIPLTEGGKIIGAIGCSGGTSAQDGVVAKAGADTVK